VRNKKATRPWQHVLEPLSGYLALAAALSRPDCDGDLCAAFNFGPTLSSNQNVAALVEEILKHWPGEWHDRSDPTAPHEAGRLNLAIDRAFHLLDWFPVWNFSETVAHTVSWYRYAGGQPTDSVALAAFTLQQITQFEEGARAAGISWAQA
jgi:CDP-glucose 4,6-dehydratase